jgi:hypothetical protein
MDDPLLVGVEVWYVAQCPLPDLGDVRGVLPANTLVIGAEVGDALVLYGFNRANGYYKGRGASLSAWRSVPGDLLPVTRVNATTITGVHDAG